ncbi:GNAT family N-acetyltransferase [Mesobacillus maritimus]|uniref:GNAT family N-acetyltransferase n=1 Tax=Mesobacillus maritimus TaxID=1643336 RepID=UPI00203D0F1C|nr:GNAT family N-acetyltransferase [Mesobacillus maritimus]MCM3585617.1 GNAT family N-acetyltransferase [Mesobacillus maritimus]MCM3669089.1 GNAT family N-acetyltransferase [Mesobacillus maritimus]
MDSEIMRANYADIPIITGMFEDCKSYLEEREILQWDEQYPSKEYFETAFAGENLFVLKLNGEIQGAMVLDEWQTPEWAEANWTEVDRAPLILHSFCVHPSFQGGGYGGKMLEFAERFTEQQGYPALRLDTYAGNEGAVKFYEKRGFKRVGKVRLNGKPEGHEWYYCFEKIF